MFTRYFLIVLTFLLGGCINLQPSDQFDQIMLTSGYTEKQQQEINLVNPVAWQLVVERPSATAFYNSSQVVVVANGYDYSYAKGIRWTGRLPDLLQSTLINFFDRTHKIEGVGAPSVGLQAKYRLIVGIDKFDISISEGYQKQQVDLVLSVKLLDLKTLSIVDKKFFSATSIIVNNRLKNVSQAFNSAFSELMFSVFKWIILHK